MTAQHLKPTGHVAVKVKGQDARPRWEQNLLRKALIEGVGGDQELRFTCRIAQDVNETFERVDLPDGTHLTLNPKAKAQFGRNKDGQAYLTVGVTWSGNGLAYRLRWVGDKVPRKMQEVAVKHDEGRAVRPVAIALDFADANIAPVRHDVKADGTRAPRRTPAKTGPHLTTRRTHARLCATDLVPAAQ